MTDWQPAGRVLVFGLVVLLVSGVPCVLARYRHRGQSTVRAGGASLAALIWLGHLLLPSFRGPLLFDVVLLAGLYPLVACESGRGQGERVFVLSAASILTVGLILDLASWRYGVRVDEAVRWVWLAAAILLPPSGWVVASRHEHRKADVGVGLGNGDVA